MMRGVGQIKKDHTAALAFQRREVGGFGFEFAQDQFHRSRLIRSPAAAPERCEARQTAQANVWQPHPDGIRRRPFRLPTHHASLRGRIAIQCSIRKSLMPTAITGSVSAVYSSLQRNQRRRWLAGHLSHQARPELSHSLSEPAW